MRNTVLVQPGIYYENILIDKPVTVLGENTNTILQGFGSKPGIEIDNTYDVTIQRLTIRGYTDGIYAEQSHNNTIENCIFSNNPAANV